MNVDKPPIRGALRLYVPHILEVAARHDAKHLETGRPENLLLYVPRFPRS